MVTAFLERGGEVLLLRRSGEVATYRGRWAGVSGYVELPPPEQALREIEEETGYAPEDVELVRVGEPLTFRDEELETEWVVHPFLFRLLSNEQPRLEHENTQWDWVDPSRIAERSTVPHLADALERVLDAP